MSRSIFSWTAFGSSSSIAHKKTRSPFWNTSITSTIQLPAYTSTIDATDDEQVNGEKPFGGSFEQHFVASQLADPTAPALPDAPDTIPICPHESSTSARIALIADLPGLKPRNQLTEPKQVDALTSSPVAHHRLPDTENVQLKTVCDPLGGDLTTPRGQAQDIMRVQGKGGYKYTHTPHYAHDDDSMLHMRISRATPCLVLCMTWTIHISSAPPTAKTIAKLGQELEKTGVQLCAHKRLNDLEVLETVYETVNPDVGLRDPVLRDQAMEEGYDCELKPFLFRYFWYTNVIFCG